MTRGSAAVASTTWVVCLCVVTHPRSLTRSLSLLLCCRVAVLSCGRVAFLRAQAATESVRTRDTQTLPLPLRFVCMLLTLLFSLTCMLCCCCCCFCVRHSPSLARSLARCLSVLLCCCIAVLLWARRVGGRLRRDTQTVCLSLWFVCADFRPRCLHVSYYADAVRIVRRRCSRVYRRHPCVSTRFPCVGTCGLQAAAAW